MRAHTHSERVNWVEDKLIENDPSHQQCITRFAPLAVQCIYRSRNALVIGDVRNITVREGLCVRLQKSV